MNFLKSKIKNISEPIKKMAVNAKQILQKSISEEEQQGSDLVFLYPRIFWMAYPTKEKSKLLIEFLNNNFKSCYYIWNISEHTYDTSIFKNQVAEYSYVGYPCPPLNAIFEICKNILEWLAKDKRNVAIIHCQNTKARSALIASCLLSVIKVVNHPLEALTYFCNKMKINEVQFLYPSQTLHLKHFANLCDNIKTLFIFNGKTSSHFPQQKFKMAHLIIVIINEIPTLKKEGKVEANNSKDMEAFRPYIQIFQNSKIVYNYLQDNQPKSYNISSKDITITFDINLEMTEDILIRCRHFKTEEERISIFRILLNPAFIFDESKRFYAIDLDISPNIQITQNFFVELIFKKSEKNNQYIDHLLKIKDECIAAAKSLKDNNTNNVNNNNNNLLNSNSPEKNLVNDVPAKVDNASMDKFAIADDMTYQEEIENQQRMIESRAEKEEDNPNKETNMVSLKDEITVDEREKIQKNEQLEKLLKLDDSEDIEDQEADDYISKLEQN